MIRYDTDAVKLLAGIATIDAKWKTKADARTAKFIKAKSYSEKSSLWSAVKPIYMRAQFFKCVFCERQFENELYGKIEVDVEHFRPKSSVLAWPSAALHPQLSYAFLTGLESASGYYWLAYDVENYAASCKPCNSSLKSNYFPVLGVRGAAGESFTDLLTEQPYLCYPLGDLDADPEDLISFVGTIARPKAAHGHDRHRGQVIIDFFDLNGRDNLHKQRATMIALVGPSLLAHQAGVATDTDNKVIAQIDSPALPHASCVRSFKRLVDDEPTLGLKLYDKCRVFAVDANDTMPPEL